MSEEWVKVAALTDLEVGAMMVVGVGDEPVCLYNLGGTVYATQNICSHEEASLAEGFIEGDCIECPLHQALFHIPTGKARTAPATEDLRIYPVKVEGGYICVFAGASSPKS